jgi:hypothetical protein
MPKYTVSADLIVPVLLEIEAESEDEALDKLHEMSRQELLGLADKDAIGIIDGSENAYIGE